MTFLEVIDLVGNLSLIGILITIIFNFWENKKTRYTNIITSQTLVNNKFIRENYAVFATLSKPEVIDEARMDKSYKYKYNIIHAVDNMETQFKYEFPYERDMMSCARDLCKTCLEYYDNQSKELDKKIREDGKLLFEMMAPYDYSDWLYVKSQAKGQAHKKNPVSFAKILEKEKLKFDASVKPTKW